MAIDFNSIRYADLGDGRVFLTWDGTPDYWAWVVVNGILMPGCPTQDRSTCVPANFDLNVQIIENTSADYDYRQELRERPKTRLSITWNASTDTDIKYFKVYGGSDDPPTDVIGTVPFDSNTYVYEFHTADLANGFYCYKVTQVDHAENESTCITSEINIIGYPAPPENVQASYDDETNMATLTWDESPDL